LQFANHAEEDAVPAFAGWQKRTEQPSDHEILCPRMMHHQSRRALLRFQ
jgi:hypothetical protein